MNFATFKVGVSKSNNTTTLVYLKSIDSIKKKNDRIATVSFFINSASDLTCRVTYKIFSSFVSEWNDSQN